jgi:hypothetical protein
VNTLLKALRKDTTVAEEVDRKVPRTLDALLTALQNYAALHKTLLWADLVRAHPLSPRERVTFAAPELALEKVMCRQFLPYVVVSTQAQLTRTPAGAAFRRRGCDQCHRRHCRRRRATHAAVARHRHDYHHRVRLSLSLSRPAHSVLPGVQLTLLAACPVRRSGLQYTFDGDTGILSNPGGGADTTQTLRMRYAPHVGGLGLSRVCELSFGGNINDSA